jgi:hypothetical protein
MSHLQPKLFVPETAAHASAVAAGASMMLLQQAVAASCCKLSACLVWPHTIDQFGSEDKPQMGGVPAGRCLCGHQ